MFRIIRYFACTLLLLFATSCIDVTTEIFVKKDGSATISQAIYMSPQAVAMMAMQKGPDGKPPQLINETELKGLAEKMGKGVTYVSAEEKTREDGAKGYIARYNVANINDLILSEALTSPGAGQAEAAGARKAVTDKLAESLRFRFTPGDSPTLAIAIPQMPENADTGKTAAPVDPAQAAMMAQMKQMFEGMRMWVRVRVDGTISETNAHYVNPKKNGITLTKIDFGKLMQDEAGFAKLQALGQNPSADKVRAALKDLPYIQAEDQKVVNIKFE